MKIDEKRISSELEGTNWYYDRDKDHIVREITTRNFKETMLIINLIGALAESHFHHPDVEFGYKKIKICLKTHSENAVTEKDIALAKDIEKYVRSIIER